MFQLLCPKLETRATVTALKRVKLHRKTFVKMQEFDDFADYVDQNGQRDLFKSWFHSNS